jgi:hypothetical protein
VGKQKIGRFFKTILPEFLKVMKPKKNNLIMLGYIVANSSVFGYLHLQGVPGH